MVVSLFFAVPLVCLQFVIVVFPEHTHLLILGDIIKIQDTINLLENP